MSQSGENDLPRYYLTEEAKLWRFQEFGFTQRLRHRSKMVFLHEDKIIIV